MPARLSAIDSEDVGRGLVGHDEVHRVGRRPGWPDVGPSAPPRISAPRIFMMRPAGGGALRVVEDGRRPLAGARRRDPLDGDAVDTERGAVGLGEDDVDRARAVRPGRLCAGRSTRPRRSRWPATWARTDALGIRRPRPCRRPGRSRAGRVGGGRRSRSAGRSGRLESRSSSRQKENRVQDVHVAGSKVALRCATWSSIAVAVVVLHRLGLASPLGDPHRGPPRGGRRGPRRAPRAGGTRCAAPRARRRRWTSMSAGSCDHAGGRLGAERDLQEALQQSARRRSASGRARSPSRRRRSASWRLLVAVRLWGDDGEVGLDVRGALVLEARRTGRRARRSSSRRRLGRPRGRGRRRGAARSGRR